MSDDPKAKNGWHAPENPDAWRELATPTPKQGRRFRLPTLPANLSTTPTRTGAWRLPARTDTTARPAPTGPRPEDAVPSTPAPIADRPEDATLAAPRPEDSTPTAPRPEDEVFGLAEETAPRPEDSTPTAPRPEDEAFALEADTTDEQRAEDTALADETAAELVDDYADALAELEDDDADAFGMSELLALQSLAEDAPAVDVEQGASRDVEVLPGDDAEQTTDADLDNLSPAERAAVGLEQTGGFDYAAQIAALQGDGVADDTLSYSAGQPPVGDTAQDGAAADSFDYASQIAALQGGDAGLDNTQALGETPAMAPVDPEQEALAQRFQQTEQEIRVLRQQRDAGQMSQQQLESNLRELMVLDNDQNWWMMGVDTEIWYRYDPNTGEWVVDTPPQPTVGTRTPDYQAVPTDTGSLDPNEVIRGSVPQVPATEEYTAGQDPFSSEGFTPATDYAPPGEIAGPTMVGTAAFRETLPSSEPTVVNPAVPGFDDDGDFTPAVDEPGVASPLDEEGIEHAPEYEEYEAYGDTVGRAKERQQRTMVSTALVTLGVIVGITLIGGAFVVGGFLYWYNTIRDRWADEVANLDLLTGGEAGAFQTVFIYDVAGNEIAELRSQEGGDRIIVPISQVSPYMIHATVSAENERFFQDSGFDPIATSRAFLQNLVGGEVISGGSTITQQLARNIVLQDETFQDEGDRKLNEIVVAQELARNKSKEELLEAYLNNVYFGNLQYGVEAAAGFYFDKSAADLNVAEAAMLAGLIAAPAQYDPVTNPQTAFDRLDFIIDRMTAANGNGCVAVPNNGGQPLCITQQFISGEAAVEIAQVKIDVYLPQDNEFLHPHFIVFVQERLQQQYTQDEIFRRGFRVYTTLNPRLQGLAENALDDQLAQLSLNGVQTGTIMVSDPQSGAIRAMVGSPDFNNETIDGQVNLALTYQQPGSAIKPISYTAAFQGVVTEQGPQGYLTPASILWDVPTTYPDGTIIRNFDNRYRGPVTARNALQQSLNVPAVKTYAFVGQSAFQQTAQAMGIRFDETAVFGLPTGVGSTEVRLFDMMEAYGTLSNSGVLQPLYAIERIEDANGNPVEFERPASTQAIAPQVAYLMTDVLTDDAARQPQFGVNNALGRGYPANTVAAKTGTSSGPRDLWTMGYTQNAVVGVWLGRIDNQPMSNTTGFAAAAPLWRRLMDETIAISAPQPFTPPAGVVERQVCTTTGTAIDPAIQCPGRIGTELFIDNQPPEPATEGFARDVQVDTWTQLLFDPNICPEDPQTITVSDIDDPTAVAWINSDAAGRQFAQSIGLPVPLVDAPQQVCGSGEISLLQASLTSPTQGQTVTEVTVPVQGIVNAGGAVSSYDIQVAPAANPNSFQIVAGPFQGAPTSQQFGTWDAANAANGEYIIRLALNNTRGGFAYRTVQINLQKPLPTATPTIPPVPTTPPIQQPPTFDVGATPIPFDTPLPFGGGLSAPTQDFSP